MKLQIHKIIGWPLCLILFVGFILVGNGNVICIGEDGHIEFETECLPCCTDADDVCKLDVSNDFHDEHDDCTNCSDLTPDEPLWIKRFQRADFGKFFNLTFTSTTESSYNLTTLGQNNSHLTEFYQLYNQSLLFPILATVLRC